MHDELGEQMGRRGEGSGRGEEGREEKGRGEAPPRRSRGESESRPSAGLGHESEQLVTSREVGLELVRGEKMFVRWWDR